MDARTRHLIERGADGELTPVERRELARSAAASTSAAAQLRREAEAWQRVESGLRGMLDQAPPLDVERIAARVEQRVGRQRAQRPWVAAASVVLIGGLALGVVEVPGGTGAGSATGFAASVAGSAAAATPGAAGPGAAPRAAAFPAPPVEVHVEGAGEAAGLVRIDF